MRACMQEAAGTRCQYPLQDWGDNRCQIPYKSMVTQDGAGGA